jgi:hypothetical protein
VTREPDPTAFDAIVASWRADGNVPEWPEDRGDDAPADPLPEPRADRSTGRPGADLYADQPGPDRRDTTARDERLGQQTGRTDPAPGDPHTTDEAATANRSDLPNGKQGSAADPVADEHFVPPEPPPLPRMGPPIIVGLTLIGLGLVLVSFPAWVGVPQVYGLPLGLVAIAAGLGWLVLRLWPDPDDVPPPLYLDDPDDPDGGAVL